MEFSTNSYFLYIIAFVIILFVLAQSAFFLIWAYRRGKQLGLSSQKLKKTVVSTAVFTIAPAISFLLGVVTLSKFLGIPLPWIRMSVIGAITYELPAATAAAAAWLLQFGGRFCICQRPERLCDLLCEMREAKIEPKRVRFVAQKAGQEPWLVLIEGRAGGNPGLRVLPTLLVEQEGRFTDEMLKIYGDYKQGHSEKI